MRKIVENDVSYPNLRLTTEIDVHAPNCLRRRNLAGTARADVDGSSATNAGRSPLPSAKFLANDMNNSNSQSRARADLMRIFAAAIAAVEPRRAVSTVFEHQLPGGPDLHKMLEKARRVYLLAAGKAAIGMAIEGRERIGPKLDDALVIVPSRGMGASDPSFDLSGIRVMAAAHPVPNESSEAAGRSALEFVSKAERDDLIVFMLSGGASALMAVPGDGLRLSEKVAVVSALTNAGASIRELNTVRRHLSAIKGGRLLKASNGKFLTLILSDVPGNDLATIGSGPTAPDSTTYSDAVAVLKRRRAWGRAPETVRDYLERGAAGELEETVKPGEPALTRGWHVIVADNATATDAARDAATTLNYKVVRGRDLTGDANQAGAALATILCGLEGARTCVIAGGETSVEVKGKGQGGRSQQAALAAAFELSRLGANRHVAALFAGTDGIDGPTDAAGAISTPATVGRGNEAGLDGKSALDRNDCYNFFKALGDLVIIGPTGTNVADIFIGLVNF
jgi:glycerate 2-kinase